jgi:hypothetical protein
MIAPWDLIHYMMSLRSEAERRQRPSHHLTGEAVAEIL